MKIEKESSIFFGFIMIIDGVHTCFTGMSSYFLSMWNMYFKLDTPKEYISGGIFILFGIYIIYMNIKRKK